MHFHKCSEEEVFDAIDAHSKTKLALKDKEGYSKEVMLGLTLGMGRFDRIEGGCRAGKMTITWKIGKEGREEGREQRGS